MLLTEYSAKEQRKMDRRDAREEGLAEGLIQNTPDAIYAHWEKNKS